MYLLRFHLYLYIYFSTFLSWLIDCLILHPLTLSSLSFLSCRLVIHLFTHFIKENIEEPRGHYTSLLQPLFYFKIFTHSIPYHASIVKSLIKYSFVLCSYNNFYSSPLNILYIFYQTPFLRAIYNSFIFSLYLSATHFITNIWSTLPSSTYDDIFHTVTPSNSSSLKARQLFQSTNSRALSSTMDIPLLLYN